MKEIRIAQEDNEFFVYLVAGYLANGTRLHYPLFGDLLSDLPRLLGQVHKYSCTVRRLKQEDSRHG